MSPERNRGETELLPVSELSYADAAAELDEIVAELDEGRVDVDILEGVFSTCDRDRRGVGQANTWRS